MNRRALKFSLLGLVALIVPACSGVTGATRDCPQPAAEWISNLRETWLSEYGDAVVTESGYVKVPLSDGTASFVALRFETLRAEDGTDVDGPIAIFGTSRPPVGADVGHVWATSGWAEALGRLARPAGTPQQEDDRAALQAIEWVRTSSVGLT